MLRPGSGGRLSRTRGRRTAGLARASRGGASIVCRPPPQPGRLRRLVGDQPPPRGSGSPFMSGAAILCSGQGYQGADMFNLLADAPAATPVFEVAGGSFVAAFIQGLMVGALVEGLPISDGQYAGGEFGWLSPFSLLCGVGLCLGYTLLGACWLVRKCEGEVRAAAYRLIPFLSIGLLVFLIVVFAYALAENLRIKSRWLERPYLFVFPAIAIVAAIVLAAS